MQLSPVLTDEQALIKAFIEKIDKKKKYVKYDFQELGLMIASRLGEWSKRSFYIKLAKEEDKKLLMQAYMYAADAPLKKRPALFLWRLEDLKQKTYYRAFTAIFFPPDKNEVIDTLYKQVKKIKGVKPTHPLHYHITLTFWDRLPGKYYSYVVRMVKKLREKYGDGVKISFSELEYIKDRYIWLAGADALAYRIYHSQRKLISKKVKDTLFKTKKQKHSFFPHVTLARIKTKNANFSPDDFVLKLPLTLEGEILFVISKLTPEGSVYRPHKWY